MTASPTSTPRRIIVLGSTGSIGTQTLEVIAHLNTLADAGAQPSHRYEVVGLVAHRNASLLAEQAARFNVKTVALACEVTDAASLSRLSNLKLLRGVNSAEELVRSVPCDIVLAAMVGSAGLPATLAAVELGRDIALANKETLVAAGELVIPAARKSGSKLLPVDSEHSALWQALLEEGTRSRPFSAICPPMDCTSAVTRIVLTASGGPFRSFTREACYHATPEQALKHPTWTMGAKVTLDSASLTNKAFEIIEAHWLFGLPADRIGAVIHPQSIVHSFVEYADGSVMAQLGTPDMRTPIQLALTFPHRPPGISPKLDLLRLATLEFQPVSADRFPALAIADRVIREGGLTGAVFNAASEIAVEAFLARKIPFGRMPELAAEAIDALSPASTRPQTLADVMAADQEARRFVRSAVEAVAGARS